MHSTSPVRRSDHSGCSNESATRCDVISSPLMSLHKTTTTPTALGNQVDVSSDIDQFSSIIDPTTFAYQDRSYHTTQRLSRSCSSHAPLIPAMQTTTKTSISISKPFTEH